VSDTIGICHQQQFQAALTLASGEDLGTGASPSSAGFSDETGLTASNLGASGERAMTGETGAAT
jgi:hypothetical protein